MAKDKAKNLLAEFWNNAGIYRGQYKCDWTCKNQPCSHIKLSNFSTLLYHNLCSIHTNKTGFLPLMQSLMESLLKLTECKYVYSFETEGIYEYPTN